MSRDRRIGILGGTFDPIHVGHLGAADAARAALGLDEILIIPSLAPPHRPQPLASAYHRFAMVALAVAERTGMAASDIELTAEGPSYTSTTLERLRRLGFRAPQLYFIAGADAFAEIAAWNDYPAILDRCQYASVSRPGHPVEKLSERLPQIAARMRLLRSPRPPGAEEAAWRTAVFLIDAQTPDVSSTEIRRRVADGRSIAGLVPIAVEQHIRRHSLYATRDAQPLRTGANHAASDLHEQNRQ